jgi:carboxyl-terminal processing protease
MRKTSLIFLGAIAGAGLTLLVTHPRTISVGSSAEAAYSDTYQQLNLFGEVFERVRADYVEKPDDNKLVQSAINGMLAGLDPHSGYMDPSSFRDIQVLTRGEFGGLGRGHDGGRPGEGRGSDRRYARRESWRDGQRRHHQARQ